MATNSRPLRADAHRNREQIIAAARQVFTEQGAEAPLEVIARRAGVGIATLYRRFPDRGALARAVAQDNMAVIIQELDSAEAAEPDAWSVLVRLLRALVRRRIGALVPLLGPLVLPDLRQDPRSLQEIRSTREQIVNRLQPLIWAAQREGRLRGDIEITDLTLGLIRLSRPIPLIDAEVNDAATERQLELFIDGLKAVAAEDTGLRREAVTAAELDRCLGLPP
ncbi:helix-turn-helix domain-containing protein [Nonomuraea sp. NPDC000554]|uniref:TetR/AcrR family transcriptional regulator n=1 Tax=Nonomuraea sp. NPDC000554 TaxID=3154259 RepID=UPI00331C171B